MIRIPPMLRITLGLISLTVSIVLVADFALSLYNDPRDAVLTERKKLVESLAVQYSNLAQEGRMDAIESSVRAMVERNDDVLSAAFHSEDGKFLAMAGEHAFHWSPPEAGRSDMNNLQVPIFRDDKQWGSVELAFASVERNGIVVMLLNQPIVVLILVISIVGLGLYSWFIRRVLKHLDPSAVIPDQVRNALNSLSEGVLVLNKKHEVMLANTAFASRLGAQPADFMGKNLSRLNWDTADPEADAEALPWAQALKRNANVTGARIMLPIPGQETRKFTVNSALIVDAGKVRGTLTTFDDVTDVERLNEHLLLTMKELETSKQQIETQNAELKRLATRDPMTGCLNRRAFFEALEPMFVRARDQGTALSCIMTDIDHFKSFNDTYGHAVGDKVIQIVAEYLRIGLGEKDLLCRYGGEEFCMILPDRDVESTVMIADAIRQRIETESAAAIRLSSGAKITSSFGVSTVRMGASEPAALIDQADQALYVSKEGGRNMVSVWNGAAGEPETGELKAAS